LGGLFTRPIRTVLRTERATCRRDPLASAKASVPAAPAAPSKYDDPAGTFRRGGGSAQSVPAPSGHIELSLGGAVRAATLVSDSASSATVYLTLRENGVLIVRGSSSVIHVRLGPAAKEAVQQVVAAPSASCGAGDVFRFGRRRSVLPVAGRRSSRLLSPRPAASPVRELPRVEFQTSIGIAPVSI
jgi:hypothetical protein